MGNKLGRRRQVVDERYTRPQGLYEHRDVDHKKLRKLILDSKLAPCYPGDDENVMDLEECPICFLYYPSLNRSRCCCKGICTECFLQMKTPNSARPTQCPFCKTSNYAVEFRGVKSREEKGIEQLEEQRVIEAKIRMRKQEIQEEETRMHKRQDMSSTSQTSVQADFELSYVPSFRSVDATEIVPSQESASMIRQPQRRRHDRDDEFDLDLDDLMVMEAIWLSIQESGRCREVGESSSSPSGGLACAIASLAERQQMNIDWDINNSNEHRFLGGTNYSNNDDNNNSIGRGWDEGGCYAAPEAGDNGNLPILMPLPMQMQMASVDLNNNGGMGYENLNNGGGGIVPESFEEQMMMAMAVSLADARGFGDHV